MLFVSTTYRLDNAIMDDRFVGTTSGTDERELGDLVERKREKAPVSLKNNF